jgi:hypothetical protein
MGLHGKLIKADLLTEPEKAEMFHLMEQFYDDTELTVFLKDLNEKDHCILLFDGNGAIQGFSTQKLLSLSVGGETVSGIFSGDTIIHKDYWGSLELFRVFARSFITLGREYPEFYWLLTSKGYKTYRMLPVFFEKFYPNYREATPVREQTVIHSFGLAKYPAEYNQTSGVVVYREVKDKLKEGVADITDSRLRDRDVEYFKKVNPDYYKGNDLVCIASLSEDNLKPGVRRLLLREGND